LDCLVSFLGDLGILSNKLTIFEVDSLYNSIMSDDSKQTQDTRMSYEKFYAWLRGVARVLYAPMLNDNRKALHALLTEVRS
jgi:hypothetical protein